MNKYTLRYSQALREELPSPDYITVVEEEKKRDTGLVDVAGLSIYRVREQAGFQLKKSIR